ncbi:MAG TPA: hypothetical protein VM370_01545 [Candidatus Thermoplasmatota archaeon]|nr:hypothetical protein [Candidatus Thermoplasmatota archaeon]
MPAWLGALVGIAALLVSAKAHGRQVRLEREAAGYHSVEFGGTNPAFVEALWRRDRLRFWPLVGALSFVLGAAAWWWRGPALALVAGLLWAPIVGFLYAGLRSYAAQRGRGGMGWWVGAAATFVVALGAAFL